MLDAAAKLFAERGVDRVSLRDIAQAADVQLPLIRRYVGRRDELLETVYQRLSSEVADYINANPLMPLDYGRDSILGRWIAMSTYYATRGQVPPSDAVSPLHALAEVFEQSFDVDHRTARIRAAQVTAISFGWRLFEDFIIAVAELDATSRDALRLDLNAMQRRIGSTPWPTPPEGPHRPEG